MEIVDVDINELEPHPFNPRMHPKKLVEKLVASFTEYGWTGNPVIATHDNRVLAGHARIKAAKEIGMATVPVFYTEFNENQANAYLIADNRLAMDSIWDTDSLKSILEMLDTGEEDYMTGFEPTELELLNIENIWAGEQNMDVEFESQKEKKDKVCPHCGGVL